MKASFVFDSPKGSDYMIGKVWKGRGKRKRCYNVIINKKTKMVHVTFRLRRKEK